MRELSSHKVNGLNEALTITVEDEPGQGNACHKYCIHSSIFHGRGVGHVHKLTFQNRPIQEVGVNGISNEALLAVVEDRLLGFQSGDFACRENALALTKLQEAMYWLHHRTKERIQRGVEGTHQK